VSGAGSVPLSVRDQAASGAASLRRLPYPNKAMLAISSDLDETPDKAAYIASMKYLNTTAPTPVGAGVGLEVGNSMYFDMPADQFSYWNTDDEGRSAIRDLMRSGHVDVLHSFGDHATTRAHAARALEDLSRHGCRLSVWVDHAVAPTNFGADIMAGQGDVEGAPAYHADLTWDYGIRFVWRGRVTSVIGQDVPRSLGGIFAPRHAPASLRTLGKEWAKGLLGRRGSPKYVVHAANATLQPARLRSGQPVREFLRVNPHWGGVSSAETAAGIGDVLSAAMLDRLVEREGFAILYTHLGKVAPEDAPFPPASRAAFERLAGYRDAGKILVTTTSRVLRYREAVENARVSSTADGAGVRIEIDLPGDGAADPQGLSVYVDDCASARLLISGREVHDVRRNPVDHTGRQSVSVPWTPLEWPHL
jgi:hypothetical protein